MTWAGPACCTPRSGTQPWRRGGNACCRASAWYREHRILGADGSYHPVLAQGVPIRREDDTIYGWAGINLDISPLKHTEEALREADRRKDEFLATLAHELRNPLAPIRHAARILDTADANEPQRKWAREVIARQVEHMALLLDDLLDVSRITRGRLDLKLEPVSLERIVARGRRDVQAPDRRQAARPVRVAAGRADRTDGRFAAHGAGVVEPADQCGQIHRR